jgi:hypothetical protein
MIDPCGIDNARKRNDELMKKYGGTTEGKEPEMPKIEWRGKTSEEQGKNAIQQVLEFMSELDEEQRIASVAGNARKIDELANRARVYGGSIETGMPLDRLLSALSTPQGKDAIMNMDATEYAILRDKIGALFPAEGPGAARIVEKTYKQNLDEIQKVFAERGQWDKIETKVNAMRGERGYLATGDLKQLDDWKTMTKMSPGDMENELAKTMMGNNAVEEANRLVSTYSDQILGSDASRIKTISNIDPAKVTTDQIAFIQDAVKRAEFKSERANLIAAVENHPFNRILTAAEKSPKNIGDLGSATDKLNQLDVLADEAEVIADEIDATGVKIYETSRLRSFAARQQIPDSGVIQTARENLAKAVDMKTRAEFLRNSPNVSEATKTRLKKPDESILEQAEKEAAFTQTLPVAEMSEDVYEATRAEAKILGLTNKVTEIDGTRTIARQDFVARYGTDLTEKNILEEYNAITKKFGKETATDVVTKDLEKKLNTIKDEALPLTNRESKLVDTVYNDLNEGKITLNKDDYKELAGIVKKLDAEGIRKTYNDFRVLWPLKYVDKQSIIWGMKKSGLAPQKNVVGVTKFVFIGLPAYFYAASFMEQQAFEAAFQFGSFGKEKDSADTLLSKYFGKEGLQNAFFNGHDALVGFYNMMGGIPIYGAYFTSVTSPGYASVIAHDGNLKDIYNHMVSRGLAVEDRSTRLGYRETTDEERIAFYEADEKALYKNDKDWIQKYGEKLYGTTGFNASEVPDGQPMTSTQIMAYYHTLKGDGVVPYTAFTALGLDERTKGWQQDQTGFVNKVLAYGDERKGTTGTMGTPATTTTTTTMDDLYEKAITNAMKRDGLTREAAIRSVNLDVQQLMDRGNDERQALEKLTGTVSTGAGTTTGTTTPGGGESSGELPNRPEDQYANSVLGSKGFRKSTQEEKQAQIVANTRSDGTLDFKALKDKDKDNAVKPKDVEYIAGKSFIEPYVKENLDTMTKEEIRDAQEAGKKETANAIMEAVGDSCEV